MRALPALPILALAACAGAPLSEGTLGRTCTDQYQQCARAPGDTAYCEEQRDACRDSRSAQRERAAEERRGYEDFRREQSGRAGAE